MGYIPIEEINKVQETINKVKQSGFIWNLINTLLAVIAISIAILLK